MISHQMRLDPIDKKSNILRVKSRLYSHELQYASVCDQFCETVQYFPMAFPPKVVEKEIDITDILHRSHYHDHRKIR